jgi:excisionase family DNA binding protein
MSTQPHQEKATLSVKELAHYVNMGKTWVYMNMRKGKIPGVVKVGGRIRFLKSEVDKKLLSGEFLLR